MRGHGGRTLLRSSPSLTRPLVIMTDSGIGTPFSAAKKWFS